MNVFRLFLCLLGLVTFLVIHNTSGPSRPAVDIDPKPSFVLSPLPELNGEAVEPIDRLELNGKVVYLKHGPDGLRYDLMTAEGNSVASNLSDDQLRAQDPVLYGLVQIARENIPANAATTLQGNPSALQ